MIYRTSTLCYRLLLSPASLEPFQVLAARSIDWQEWRVTFRVLGASHAVSLEREGRRVTELLTCTRPACGGEVLVEQLVGRGGPIGVATGGLVSRVCLTVFPLPEGDALRGGFPAADELAAAFPASPGGTVPLTRIGWRVRGRQLLIETVHTYPEEGRGVRSESCFEQHGE